MNPKMPSREEKKQIAIIPGRSLVHSGSIILVNDYLRNPNTQLWRNSYHTKINYSFKWKVFHRYLSSVWNSIGRLLNISK